MHVEECVRLHGEQLTFKAFQFRELQRTKTQIVEEDVPCLREFGEVDKWARDYTKGECTQVGEEKVLYRMRRPCGERKRVDCDEPKCTEVRERVA